MNHVSVEEVEAQPDALIGKFLVKSFTAIVLFDTGASHSYISRGFVDKYKLPTQALRSPMLVTSPGAEHMASLWSLVEKGHVVPVRKGLLSRFLNRD